MVSASKRAIQAFQVVRKDLTKTVDPNLGTSLGKLTPIQRQAVNWDKGALLVLAGPRSGKTQVLTCRIARLLDESRDQRFRVLALTLTNKAADEMKDRVRSFVPELEDRADIFTFHSFCSGVLRQHGAHIGLKPGFRIYSRKEDRQAVLRNAIRRDPSLRDRQSFQLLPLIDRLKSQLIRPEEAVSHLKASAGSSIENSQFPAAAYRLYEEELRRANALDFHSLILEAHKLLKHPALARYYQTVYRYWLIDEFQDTNDAQYKLLRCMAGNDFREVFAVADDDQTIYEWNGANVHRISALVSDFGCDLIQFPTNFRCAPQIVEAANRLVVYNAQRLKNKQPSISVRQTTEVESIQFRVFPTDQEEVAGITNEIIAMGDEGRSRTAVLARSRSMLQSMHDHLEAKGVRSAMLMRRDDFVSPNMRWMIACLRQINRPLDRHNLSMLVNTFDAIAPVPIDPGDIISRASATSISYLSIWAHAALRTDLPPHIAKAVKLILSITDGSQKLSAAIDTLAKLFGDENDDPGLQDDLSAWRELSNNVNVQLELPTLDQFLQELDLRSKNPVPQSGFVSLATIHGAKGLEFDTVYLMGMAEGILPSWQSIQQNNRGSALEEERRACFVAITRAKNQLVLSRSDQYRGYSKEPSRFLREMGMLNRETPPPVSAHITELA